MSLEDICTAAAWCYIPVAAVTFLVPLIVAATAWSSERSHRTLESLVLAPHDHAAMARGRFLHVVMPWLRFMIWMFPLYVLLARNGVIEDSLKNRAPQLLTLTGWPAGTKPFFGLLLAVGRWDHPEGITALAVALSVVRWAHDFLDLMAVSAVTFYLSARCKGPGGGLLATLLIALGMNVVVFSFADWALLAMGLANEIPRVSISAEEAGVVYLPLAMLTLALKLATGWMALRLLTRRFDRYAIAERAPG